GSSQTERRAREEGQGRRGCSHVQVGHEPKRDVGTTYRMTPQGAARGIINEVQSVVLKADLALGECGCTGQQCGQRCEYVEQPFHQSPTLEVCWKTKRDVKQNAKGSRHSRFLRLAFVKPLEQLQRINGPRSARGSATFWLDILVVG